MDAAGSAATPLVATLYTKPGCGLCDELRHLLLELQREFDFTLVERNIEESAEEFARYRYLIPVLSIPGAEDLCPPHDAETVRRALVRAAGGEVSGR